MEDDEDEWAENKPDEVSAADSIPPAEVSLCSLELSALLEQSGRERTGLPQGSSLMAGMEHSSSMRDGPPNRVSVADVMKLDVPGDVTQDDVRMPPSLSPMTDWSGR
jgi:hypothetical protein